MDELSGFSGGGVMGLVVAIAALVGLAAPMVLCIGKGRNTPQLLTVILTIAAVAFALFAKTSFDLMLAVGVWIGGMIAGAAGYLRAAIQTAARNHAYRLIHMHDAGLTKPRDTD